MISTTPRCKLRVGLDHLDFLLGLADGDVVGSHVAQQRHQGVIVGLDQAHSVVGRFDRAAELAPEIQLPTEVQTVAELVEEAADDRRVRAHRHADPLVPAGGLLGLREELSAWRWPIAAWASSTRMPASFNVKFCRYASQIRSLSTGSFSAVHQWLRSGDSDRTRGSVASIQCLATSVCGGP